MEFVICINAAGQVVGDSGLPDFAGHAFRTAPNSPINPAADDVGMFGDTEGKGDHSAATINASGQVVGGSFVHYGAIFHPFRTASNQAIHPETDDLGTLGGLGSNANRINVFGQVVGESSIAGDTAAHAFRTGPNSPINPATDDLGTLTRSLEYGNRYRIDAMRAQQINRVSSKVLIVLSLTALLAVLSGYAQPHHTDEGAAAHIFQLSIMALVPMIFLFLTTGDRKQPSRSSKPLVFPPAALVLAFAALYYLEHYR